MSETKLCPICQHEMSDTRHVTVECFFKVTDSAPAFRPENNVWREIEYGGNYLGMQRRYDVGQEIGYSNATDENGVIKVTSNWDKSAPRIQLQRMPAYRMECCKACRADFLKFCREWSAGIVAKESKFERD
jgi:hypothetical protein